jgi:hypothetical protein
MLLRLSGSFDLPQALELRDELAGTGDEVILDFSQVDDLRVHALGIVAQAASGRIHLLGLRQHHVDVLGYLGFDVDDRGRLVRRPADAAAG